MKNILIIFLFCIFIHKNTYSNDLNISQKEIIQKMADFLECEPNINPEQLAFIKELRKSPGECKGFSALWLLGKRIQDKPNPDDEERDDNIFFNRAIKLLSTKVNKNNHSLNSSEKVDVKRFISFIFFFQRFSSEFALGKKRNFDFNVAYNGLTGKKLQQPFGKELELIVNQTILSDRLQKILKPGAMIMFGLYPTDTTKNTGHQLAFYQSRKDEKIYFYDPNNEKGEKLFSPKELRPINNGSVSELVSEIWSDIKLSSNDIDYETVVFKRLKINVLYMPEDETIPFEDLRLTTNEVNNLRNEAKKFENHRIPPLKKLQEDMDFWLSTYIPATPVQVSGNKILSENTSSAYEKGSSFKDEAKNEPSFVVDSNSLSTQEDLSITRPVWWNAYNFKDFNQGVSALIRKQQEDTKNRNGQVKVRFRNSNDTYYFMNLGFLYNGRLFIYDGNHQNKPTFKNLGAVDKNNQIIERKLKVGERVDMLADHYWTVDQGIIYEGWNPDQRTAWGPLINTYN